MSTPNPLPSLHPLIAMHGTTYDPADDLIRIREEEQGERERQRKVDQDDY